MTMIDFQEFQKALDFYDRISLKPGVVANGFRTHQLLDRARQGLVSLEQVSVAMQ